MRGIVVLNGFPCPCIGTCSDQKLRHRAVRDIVVKLASPGRLRQGLPKEPEEPRIRGGGPPGLPGQKPADLEVRRHEAKGLRNKLLLPCFFPF